MKRGFYPRLAADGIRKNRQLYLPYLLTQAGMVTVLYILLALPRSPAVQTMSGSRTINSILFFGSFVMAMFACIFLFYTNSFLIRRRKKEFGLYHILGMGKRNIGVILFWETLIGCILSLLSGLILGIALSKLAELVLVRLSGGEQTFTMNLSLPAIAMTAIAFGGISVLLLLNGLRQVHLSSAVSLLRSEQQGEKPPKGNWVLGILGAVILICAYAISLRIQQPVSAMVWFFIAVLMVIIATYLLMISGSVLFCRILQKSKRYYYRPNHFVSLSSMVFRMKRNGAGLASICILCTMALVTISTTSCLYSGVESGLLERYPREISVTFWPHKETDEEPLQFDHALISELQDSICAEAADSGAAPQNAFSYVSVGRYMNLHGSELSMSSVVTEEESCLLYFVPLKDYQVITGSTETLEENQVLMALYRTEYSDNVVTVDGAQTFQVKAQVDDFPFLGEITAYVYPTIILIVPDLDALLPVFAEEWMENGGITLRWDFCFDTGLDSGEQLALRQNIQSLLKLRLKDTAAAFSTDSRESNRQDFYSSYGALLFLGILLSAVFLLSAVLIIYYKQISEGYEDQSRFAIMRKVGMSRPEIRKSINSQLLTVFFLPLLGAGMHMGFAFPIVRKLLLLFNLHNTGLFLRTTIVSYLALTLLYVLVYRLTSNTYYQLVSGTREE